MLSFTAFLAEYPFVFLPGHLTCPCSHISFTTFHKTFDNINGHPFLGHLTDGNRFDKGYPFLWRTLDVNPPIFCLKVFHPRFKFFRDRLKKFLLEIQSSPFRRIPRHKSDSSRSGQ